MDHIGEKQDEYRSDYGGGIPAEPDPPTKYGSRQLAEAASSRHEQNYQRGSQSGSVCGYLDCGERGAYVVRAGAERLQIYTQQL